ncbi:MAG: isopenicillin N synthase family oxygenase [Alphaproteobacteria bacterium]|nr:isopenicillin N synthase family oxygenase [Alphaproteobacteria bacterium]
MTLFAEHAPVDMQAAVAEIPVLDFGPCFRGEAGALGRLADQLRRACERVGFFYISGHGVPQALVDRAFAASKRFHALPLEAKLELKLNLNNIGYMPMNASMQRHSTVHRATKPNQNDSYFVSHDRGPEHPEAKAAVPLRGMNQWPEGLAGFCDPSFRSDVMAYFQALHDLGQRMLPAFATALDMPADAFAEYFAGETHANLRLLHYPPTGKGENEFGTAPHTDNSFLTILARTGVPGLGIRLPSGEWVHPPLIEGTFICNLGNIMRRWSNDRFLSTPHAVIVEGDDHRYSIAYFHSPNPDRTLTCLPSCVSAANPAKHPPAVYRDLVLEFYRANYFHQPGGAPKEAAD